MKGAGCLRQTTEGGPMARPDKEAAVADLADKFRSCGAVLLTEYRGLSVADLRALRRSLADNAEYAVVKNTLAAIAARRAGLEDLAEDFTGPSALALPAKRLKRIRSERRRPSKANSRAHSSRILLSV